VDALQAVAAVACGVSSRRAAHLTPHATPLAHPPHAGAATPTASAACATRRSSRRPSQRPRPPAPRPPPQQQQQPSPPRRPQPSPCSWSQRQLRCRRRPPRRPPPPSPPLPPLMPLRQATRSLCRCALAGVASNSDCAGYGGARFSGHIVTSRQQGRGSTTMACRFKPRAAADRTTPTRAPCLPTCRRTAAAASAAGRRLACWASSAGEWPLPQQCRRLNERTYGQIGRHAWRLQQAYLPAGWLGRDSTSWFSICALPPAGAASSSALATATPRTTPVPLTLPLWTRPTWPRQTQRWWLPRWTSCER
jgi:hypothetical protein